MAGEAAAAAARLPSAFLAARNGGVRRALRVPGSAATLGPALRGLWGRRSAARRAAEGLRRAKGNGAGLPSPARTSPSAGGRGAVPRAPAGRGGQRRPVLGALVGWQRAAVAGKCPSRPAPHCPLSLGGKTKCPWSREGEGAAAAPAVLPPSPPAPLPEGGPGDPGSSLRAPPGREGTVGPGCRRRSPAPRPPRRLSGCGAAPGPGNRGWGRRRAAAPVRQRAGGCGAVPLRAAPSRPPTPPQQREAGGCRPWHGSSYAFSPEAPVCFKEHLLPVAALMGGMFS